MKLAWVNPYRAEMLYQYSDKNPVYDFYVQNILTVNELSDFRRARLATSGQRLFSVYLAHLINRLQSFDIFTLRR